MIVFSEFAAESTAFVVTAVAAISAEREMTLTFASEQRLGKDEKKLDFSDL